MHTFFSTLNAFFLTVSLVLLSVCPGTADTDRPASETKNSCPIILVHGFAGWGDDAVAGTCYWGGSYCLKDFLGAHGYSVYTARVGPFSSNWDRAIELYYQIKGGQVDYGKVHSETFGHVRRPAGAYYHEPLYPQWDQHHPVHLVGHSMGGQTIRMLSALLAGRAPEFQNILNDADGRAFTPGKGWIQSITTISTPHNGTSLVDLADNPVAIGLTVAALSGLEVSGLAARHGYDLHLEQWGITPDEQETLYAYLHRMLSTLGTSPDFSLYELSTSGAARFNQAVHFGTMDNDAWYFSISNHQTTFIFEDFMCMPSLGMHPALYPLALLICNSPLWTDPLSIGRAWRQNDGLVNTASMIAPIAGCRDPYSEFTGTPVKEAWNHLGCVRMDHFEIVGQHPRSDPLNRTAFDDLYLGLCELLSSLEER